MRLCHCRPNVAGAVACKRRIPGVSIGIVLLRRKRHFSLLCPPASGVRHSQKSGAALVARYLNSSPMAGLIPYFRSGIVAASEQYGRIRYCAGSRQAAAADHPLRPRPFLGTGGLADYTFADGIEDQFSAAVEVQLL